MPYVLPKENHSLVPNLMLNLTQFYITFGFFFSRSIMIFKSNTKTLATYGKKIRNVTILQPDGLPRNAEQIKKIKQA